MPPKRNTKRKTSGRCAENAISEGQGGENEIAPPEELAGPVAVRTWRRLVTRLRDRLSLLDIDYETLVAYCDECQLLADIRAVLKKAGSRYITMPDTGYVSRHPAVVDEKNAKAEKRKLAAELGLTPKARRGMKVRSSEGDPLKSFLDAKPGARKSA